MRKLVQWSVAFVFVSTLLTTGSPGTARAAAPDRISQVEVVNTPTVNLATGSSVSVTGTVPVRAQDTAPQVPVRARAVFTGGGNLLFTVPAGQRLVIEHVSGYLFLDQGGLFVVRLTDQSGNALEFLTAAAQGPVTPDGVGLYVFNHTARIDLLGGASGEQLEIEVAAPLSTASGEVVMTGYLIPN